MRLSQDINIGKLNFYLLLPIIHQKSFLLNNISCARKKQTKPPQISPEMPQGQVRHWWQMYKCSLWTHLQLHRALGNWGYIQGSYFGMVWRRGNPNFWTQSWPVLGKSNRQVKAMEWDGNLRLSGQSWPEVLTCSLSWFTFSWRSLFTSFSFCSTSSIRSSMTVTSCSWFPWRKENKVYYHLKSHFTDFSLCPPYKMPRERTANVCLGNRGWIFDERSEHCMDCYKNSPIRKIVMIKI